MNGDGNSEGVGWFHHHMVAAFDPIQAKSELPERPDDLPAARRGSGRHLAGVNDAF